MLTILSLLYITIQFSPSILELDQHIYNLQKHNQLLANRRTKLSSIDYSNHYHIQNIKAKQHCIFKAKSPLEVITILTSHVVVIAINHPENNSLTFLNENCSTIRSFSNVQIHLLLCDRGNCHFGNIYFVGKDNIIYFLDQQLQRLEVFTKIKSEESMIGGLMRWKNKQKMQILVADQKGNIRVYDEDGNNKLTINLEMTNSNLQKIVDHHPYPILVSSNNWLSSIDTAKYIQVTQNCPFISNTQTLFVDNHYSELLYLITTDKIYLIEMEIGKRACHIKRQYPLSQNLPTPASVALYNNALFMDNHVYNFTEKKLYTHNDCASSSFNFVQKKYEKSITGIRKCCNGEVCNVEVLLLDRTEEIDRNSIFWIVSIFVLVLFFAIRFMKKNVASGFEIDQEQQIKYRQIQEQIDHLSHSKKPKPKKK